MQHLLEIILGLIACQILFYKLRPLPKIKSIGFEKNQKVSVIIPACNEEENLPKLLTSLLQQAKDIHEIIVVDDNSEDETYEIAKSFNVTVIRSGEKNNEWIGKSFACFEGTKVASGNTYLFVDADTVFLRDGIKSMINTFNKERGVLSVQPYHEVNEWFEQCSIFFNLILVGSIHSFSLFSTSRTAIGLFGPVIMISKEDYEAIGGHERVKNKVVEDLALGQELKKIGIPRLNFIGQGCIKFKMYDSFSQLIEGWTKNFASGATSTQISIFLLVFAYLCGNVAMSIELILNLDSILMWVFYLCYVVQLRLIMIKLGSFKASTQWFFPIYLSVFLFIFIFSVIKTYMLKTVQWKGRKIKL